MDSISCSLTDFDQWIDDVHSFLNEVRHQSSVSEFALGGNDEWHRMRQAVHEWVANLYRHAQYGSRAPSVHINVKILTRGFTCVVEDNSDGFDLEESLKQSEKSIQPFPEKGMGLLFMRASASKLSYERGKGIGNRLQMSFIEGEESSSWAPKLF